MDANSMPVIMSPKDVQIALGLGENQINQVYNLFRSKKFPSERVGGKHVIPRGRFLNWLGEEEKEE